MTWNPPESVRIGPGQSMNWCSPPKPSDPFRAGAQHQVVGVAQHQPCAGRAHRVGGHRLHRAGGADRHEHRRLDRAMRGGQHAGTGGAVGGGDRMREGRRDGVHPARYASGDAPALPRAAQPEHDRGRRHGVRLGVADRLGAVSPSLPPVPRITRETGFARPSMLRPDAPALAAAADIAVSWPRLPRAPSPSERTRAHYAPARRFSDICE